MSLRDFLRAAVGGLIVISTHCGVTEPQSGRLLAQNLDLVAAKSVGEAGSKKSAAKVANKADEGENAEGPVAQKSVAHAPAAEADSDGKLDGEEIYNRLLSSAAFIAIVDPQVSGYSMGTGWIADKERRLIVTNQHVVCKSHWETHPDEHIRVYFPEMRDDQLWTSRDEVVAQGEWRSAAILDVDMPRDIAVLQLDSLPDGSESLPLAEKSARPGNVVYSLGNPAASPALWVFSDGVVRQIYRQRQRMREGDYDYMCVETTTPTNGGDSGGAVVNDHAQVVAMTHSAMTGEARLMTHFVDLSEIQTVLAKVRGFADASTAEELSERGVEHFDETRFAKALVDFSASLKLDPRQPDVLGRRGWTWMQQEDYDTALVDFNEAIALDGEKADFHQGRSRTYSALGMTKEAVEDITHAIRLEPQAAAYYNDRGDLRYVEENYDQALNDYDQAVRLDPQDPTYHNNRGLALTQKQMWQEAIDAHARAFELKPEEPVYLLNRGMAYSNAGETQQAVADFTSLQQLDPQFAEEHKTHFDRRYLHVANATGERIQVWIKYHTQNSDDEWEWYPSGPDEERYAIYWLEPGETKAIEHDEFMVNADRIRMWAGNAPSTEQWDESTRRWADYEDQDFVLTPEEGYRAYFMETFVLTIQ